MQMIETKRLLILPLNTNDLECYLLGDDKFERKYALKETGRTVSREVREAVSGLTIPSMKSAGPLNYLYFTFWLVVEKSSHTIVAELGFKGKPNDRGEIEIGYGTMFNHRKKGFMTEAVAGMIKWAFDVPEVRWILAETDEANTGSIRIMEKNGFTRFDKRENMLWWKIATK